MIGALRDHGLSRHADDCEMDIWEKDVELLQSLRMKARSCAVALRGGARRWGRFQAWLWVCAKP